MLILLFLKSPKLFEAYLISILYKILAEICQGDFFDKWFFIWPKFFFNNLQVDF